MMHYQLAAFARATPSSQVCLRQDQWKKGVPEWTIRPRISFTISPATSYSARSHLLLKYSAHHTRTQISSDTRSKGTYQCSSQRRRSKLIQGSEAMGHSTPECLITWMEVISISTRQSDHHLLRDRKQGGRVKCLKDPSLRRFTERGLTKMMPARNHCSEKRSQTTQAQMWWQEKNHSLNHLCLLDNRKLQNNANRMSSMGSQQRPMGLDRDLMEH